MDGVTHTDTSPPASTEQGTAPAGPPPPVLFPRRRMPKWPFVLAGFLLAVGVAVGVVWPINVPYYALSPGPVNDVTDYISVDDPAEATGDLFFLTVSPKEVNLLEYLAGLLNDEIDLTRRENIRPAGVTPQELREQNLALMELSKQNAVFVALTRLGYDVTFEGTGALVSGVIDGSAADGVLEVDDVIVGFNGAPIEFQTDLIDLITGLPPGETVALTIERADAGVAESFDVDITLGVYRAEDEDGNPVVDEERGMIGVLLTTAPTEVIFPVEVVIDSQNIGGPSAGMMFTLEIMNQLIEEDLTRGHRIAGTGTIDQEGAVGAIGGVRQKVFGAIDAGAEFVLVPPANFDDAVDAAGDDIQVIEVETIEDALAFLETLPER